MSKKGLGNSEGGASMCERFVSRHEERDLDLPRHRELLMRAIESDLQADDNVLAAFYGGSIGNENADLYSDIDLRIVVKTEKIKEYVSNKLTRPRRWGNVLYFEDTYSSSIYTVVHFDSFVKVDTFYYKREDIVPSVWLKNIKIIKDTSAMLAKFLDRSMLLSYEPTFKEIELWRTKFFAHLHEAYRRTMREEYYYALRSIDNLRLSMVTAWYMGVGVHPNTFGDWAKYEGERSELVDWQQMLLKSWACGRDPIEIMDVMKGIADEFIKVHKSLCDRVEVDNDPEWVNEIIGMVI